MVEQSWSRKVLFLFFCTPLNVLAGWLWFLWFFGTLLKVLAGHSIFICVFIVEGGNRSQNLERGTKKPKNKIPCVKGGTRWTTWSQKVLFFWFFGTPLSVLVGWLWFLWFFGTTCKVWAAFLVFHWLLQYKMKNQQKHWEGYQKTKGQT